MQKTVLITGASSGFGKACAEVFSSNHWRLIITGRREERLQEIATNLTRINGTKILVLPFDVRNKDACFNAMQNLPNDWQQIDLLINNAGLALGRDFFEEADINDWDTMIDTNLKGLLYITRAALPYLIKTSGHIINIGSIAGKEVYQFGNAYSATKAAVDAISQGMRIDLLRHKIKVTAIHPGAADTEFSNVRFKGDDAKAATVYQGYQPLIGKDVAEVIFYCATLPPHVCINDLVITPTAQAGPHYLYKG